MRIFVNMRYFPWLIASARFARAVIGNAQARAPRLAIRILVNITSSSKGNFKNQ
jgi:hypothetical protein